MKLTSNCKNVNFVEKTHKIQVAFLSGNIQPIRRASSFSSIFSIFYQYTIYINFILFDGWAHLFRGNLTVFNHFLGKGRKRSYS
jgi:hypothetical protein